MKLGRAIALASNVFEGEKDKGGKPYILHCIWVMMNVRHLGELAMTCAILHDVVEDSEWTIADIRTIYGDEVANVLDLLTHRDEDSYETYIKKIATNPLAVQIKLKDLEHNMKPNRLKGLTKKDHDRMDKYMRWYMYLSKL